MTMVFFEFNICNISFLAITVSTKMIKFGVRYLILTLGTKFWLFFRDFIFINSFLHESWQIIKLSWLDRVNHWLRIFKDLIILQLTTSCSNYCGMHIKTNEIKVIYTFYMTVWTTNQEMFWEPFWLQVWDNWTFPSSFTFFIKKSLRIFCLAHLSSS